MSPLLLVVVLFLASLPIIYLLKSRKYSSKKKLPPGSFGYPVVGGTLGFLRSTWENKNEEWAQRMIEKYGPISKHRLLGTPTVLLAGQAANKFVFTNEALAPQQVKPLARLIGERNMMQLVGDDHRRVRGAVSQFLRLEMLKRYVGKIDDETRQHIHDNWTGHQNVTVLPLAKSFTFDVICAIIFGIGRGAVRNRLMQDFIDLSGGMWAPLVGLPFLNLNKSMRARRRIRKKLNEIVQDRKAALNEGKCDPNQDLITYLIDLGRKDAREALTDEEIIDNAVLVFQAGYDTSSTLIACMVRHLANDPTTRAEVIREQEEIANSKASSEDPLTWDDILKMKYTWRFAMEVLRMIPPVFGSMRKVLADVEYNGYVIPKGWHVLWVSNVTQMDSNIFPQPTKFDPTRFENQLSIPPYCYVPFGGGLRVCPGNEFARLETLVIMHYLVTRFKWMLCCKNDVLRRYPLPTPAQGLPIQLEPKC